MNDQDQKSVPEKRDMTDRDRLRAFSVLYPILERARNRQLQSRLSEILLQVALLEEQCQRDPALFRDLEDGVKAGFGDECLGHSRAEERNVRLLISRWLAQEEGPARGAASSRAMNEGGSSRCTTVLQEIPLNKREKQILSLLNEGLSNAQLAERCFISEGTVKWYLHQMYEKFAVANRTALLVAARNLGIAA